MTASGSASRSRVAATGVAGAASGSIQLLTPSAPALAAPACAVLLAGRVAAPGCSLLRWVPYPIHRLPREPACNLRGRGGCSWRRAAQCVESLPASLFHLLGLRFRRHGVGIGSLAIGRLPAAIARELLNFLPEQVAVLWSTPATRSRRCCAACSAASPRESDCSPTCCGRSSGALSRARAPRSHCPCRRECARHAFSASPSSFWPR